MQNVTTVSSLDFGTITHGYGSSTLQITIQNPDPENSANVYGFTLPSGYTSDFTQTVIQPYGSMAVNITLSDSAIGTYNGDLAIAVDGQTQLTVVLSGSVIPVPAILSVSPENWDFGTIKLNDGDATKTFTLHNSGEETLFISSVSIGQHSDFFTVDNSGPFGVAGGDSQSVVVTLLDDTASDGATIVGKLYVQVGEESPNELLLYGVVQGPYNEEGSGGAVGSGQAVVEYDKGTTVVIPRTPASRAVCSTKQTLFCRSRSACQKSQTALGGLIPAITVCRIPKLWNGLLLNRNYRPYLGPKTGPIRESSG
jgi:hypothetical protein